MASFSEAPSRSSEATPLQLDADVIVIGSGPAGMSVAIGVAKAGLKTIVVDMQPGPGGQIFRSLESNLQARPSTDELLGALGPTYTAGEALVREFRSTPNIDYRPETTVWDLKTDGTVGWLKGDSAGYLRAREVVVANGAMERPVPFPGWTLPGVMTAGAVQTLLKAGRLQPDGHIVLVGTGPLIFLLADQLRRLGIKPTVIGRTDRFKDKLVALKHLRPSGIPALAKGLGWLAKLRLAGVPMHTGVSDLQAHGTDKVESASLMVDGQKLEVPCDLLIVHDGIVPSIDIAHCAGLAMEWQDADSSWRPKTSLDGKARFAQGPTLIEGPCRIRISGDARRIGGADAAIAHGNHVANSLLAQLGTTTLSVSDINLSGAQAKRALEARPFIDRAFPLGLAAAAPSDDTIVCRCEELSAGSLRSIIRDGATDMNHVRGVLRCGMGPCQGRSCATTLARLLKESNFGLEPVPFRARPPLRPLPLIALANLTGVDPDLAQVVSLEDKPATGDEGANHAQ